MMELKKHLIVTFGSLFSVTVFAANGYFPTGYGVQSKGMAGAGVAYVSTALGGANNPALLAHTDNQYDLELSLFHPPRGFKAYPLPGATSPIVTPGTYNSKDNYFLAPSFAYNRRLDEYWTVGFSLTGNGMSSKYDAAIFDAFNMSGAPDNDATAPAGVELRQYFLGVPVSYKINEKHAMGITPMVVIQSFKAYGGEPFQQVSIHPDSVTNNGTDCSDGLGVKLGWYGKLTDSLSVGAIYQPRINMSKFNKYKGLFAEEGDFDIPATASIGIAYKIKPTLIGLFDYQHIAYSDVNSLGNSNDVALVTTPPPFSTLPSWLGQKNGAGGGWKDADIYKLGAEWKYSKQWEFRAGYSWMNTLIPGSQALINIVAPAVNEEHYSLGATYNIDNESILNFALTHSPEVRTDGYNTNLGGVTGQQGEIYMEQSELSISYSWTF